MADPRLSANRQAVTMAPSESALRSELIALVEALETEASEARGTSNLAMAMEASGRLVAAYRLRRVLNGEDWRDG